METFIETVILEKRHCLSCSGIWAVNKTWMDHRREMGGAWHCPYCGERWSWTDNELTRTRKALEEKERELRASKCETLKEQQRREQSEEREVKVSRKLARVSKGVCPCCKRSFSNLKRHMESKHPDQVEGAHARTPIPKKAARS